MFFSIIWPIGFGLIAVAVTVVGLLAITKIGDWSKKNVNLFTFAAIGMLITLCLTHIIPIALSTTSNALTFVLAGFFLGLTSQHLLKSNSNIGDDSPSLSNVLPIIAIGIHSFVDGIIFSLSFATNHTSGLSVSTALALHEFPEAMITYAILQRYNLTPKAVLIWTILVAGVTTFMGAFISAPVAHLLDKSILGIPFALSGGLLLYVATGPLASSVKTEPAVRSLPSLAIGVLIAFAFTSVHAHDDEHEKGSYHSSKQVHPNDH